MVNNTPNGLIVLNENLEVQQINAAARRIMNIRSASDVLGEGVVRILDTNIFDRVLKSKRSVRNERTYLAEYKKYVEQTVVYDPTYHLLVCIMRDITDEETERQKKKASPARRWKLPIKWWINRCASCRKSLRFSAKRRRKRKSRSPS